MKIIGERGEQILTVDDFKKTERIMNEFKSIKSAEDLTKEFEAENEANRKSLEQENQRRQDEIGNLDQKIDQNRNDYEELQSAYEKSLEGKEELERLGVDTKGYDETQKKMKLKLSSMKGANTRWTNKKKNLAEIIKNKEQELQQKTEENQKKLEQQIKEKQEEKLNFLTLERLNTITVEKMKMEIEIEREKIWLEDKKKELEATKQDMLEAKKQDTEEKRAMVKKNKRISKAIANQQMTKSKKQIMVDDPNMNEYAEKEELAIRKIETIEEEIEALENNISELENKYKEYEEFLKEMNRIKILKKEPKIEDMDKKPDDKQEKPEEEPQKEPAEAVEEPAEAVEEPAEAVEEPAEAVEEPEEAVEEPEEAVEEPEEAVEEPEEPVIGDYDPEQEDVVEGPIIEEPEREGVVFSPKIKTEGPAEQLHKNKPIKIVLGNTGRISYDGKNCEIPTEAIGLGLTLTRDFKEGILSSAKIQEELGVSEAIADQLTESTFDRETPIDFSVVLAIQELDIPKEEKEKLIDGYIIDAVKSQEERKTSEGKEVGFKEKAYSTYLREDISITYDMNNLSKVPFFKTLFARNPSKENLSGEEKEFFAKLAADANRYGLGKTVGTYKEPFSNKILNLFRRRQNLLPEGKKMKTIDMTDEKTIAESTVDEYDVAKYYDEMVYAKIDGTEQEYAEAVKEAARKLREEKKYDEARDLIELAKTTRAKHDVNKLRSEIRVSDDVIKRTEEIGQEAGEKPEAEEEKVGENFFVEPEENDNEEIEK